jgi:hypothetical protein
MACGPFVARHEISRLHDRLLFRPSIPPSWRKMCERTALSLIAAAWRWSLPLLPPLLSAQLTPAQLYDGKPTRTADARLQPRTISLGSTTISAVGLLLAPLCCVTCNAASA